jgi:hypothetical protein
VNFIKFISIKILLRDVTFDSYFFLIIIF